MKYNNIISNTARLTAIALLAGAVTACGDEDIDNSYSRTNAVIQLTTSSDYVVLDEANPDAVALTVEWNPAMDYGNDYITTYSYKYDVSESTKPSIKEYEDDGNFRRTYTNKDLQTLLVDHFGALTSSVYTLNLNVTADFNGPRTVIPDIATAQVRVKTYGPKQFRADRLYIANGDNTIEIQPTSATSNIYSYMGKLTAGAVSFPVDYAGEENAIAPASGTDTPVTEDEMAAAMVDRAGAASWIISEDETYRVTVDLNKKTVKIVVAGAVLDIDQLFLSGSAVGSDDIEIVRTLEDDAVYAWRGELKAGTLCLPILYEEQKSLVIVPKKSTDSELTDGLPMDFGQVPAASLGAQGWTIPADGTYRVVVNTTQRNVTVYSAATDLKPVSVSYNNTVDKINPYTQEVTRLWMWGGFNDMAHDTGLKAGFQEKYSLTPSLADPQVFVYSGSAIPRGANMTKWGGETIPGGALTFLVSSIENNVYAYGSTADAKRNDHHGFTNAAPGVEEKIVGGQGDNRYACFVIPEGCNYVCVNLRTMTVVFEVR